ncbi:hypothetical protein [Vreelandella populi]|uniref:hypothetical protein n=1 Tax=Vreelandella populi TaxID=2498858 RepID=UPI000F8C55F0|nr:hypothetical protein [Halomonas populi]RUR51510.1 hypothetical protein ELY40_17085 [Halomonas populi]
MALVKEGSAMRDMYERMPIGRLREIARESHADHDPEATRIFVSRVLDMEVERRTWFAHENLGYQPFSSTAKLGEHPGGGTAAADPLAIAYDRGIRVHAAHEEARQFLAYAKLKPRVLLAALIQAAKTDRRVTGPWAKSYDQIAADLGPYAQRLGFSPGNHHGITMVCYDKFKPLETGWLKHKETRKAVPLFKNGQAIKDSARQCKIQLLLISRL